MKMVKIVARLFLILIVSFVLVVFYNPFVGIVIKYNQIEIAAARDDLPIARANWEEQNIDHYSFEIWATNHVCIANARVEVKNEKVAQVNLKDSITGDISSRALSPSLWTNNKLPIDWFSCHYSPLTMDYLFDKAEQILNYSGEYCLVDFSFDRLYGFVSQAGLQYRPYGRLMGPRVEACTIGFRIENFHVLDE